jgi:acyl-CoA synthetase (AMP-forming)/AMP-acid ligase II
MLYSLLSKAAQRHPGKTAVVCGSVRYDYDHLINRVEKLASGLSLLGISRYDRIAVVHKNCHRYLELYFAAARIGAVLVPINYRLTYDEFEFILHNSRSKILVSQPYLLTRIAEKKRNLPFLDVLISTASPMDESSSKEFMYYESIIQRSHSEGAPEKALDSDTAQIYYTSGTTGRPKGVILTHKNNFVHAEGTVQELRLTSEDRWLHVSPMFHLADAWAVWAITMAGGTHVVIPEFDPKTVLEVIGEQKITLSNFIPTMINILVNHPDVNDHDCSSLRVLLSGGAPIAKEVVRKALEIFKCDYIQTYGLTETSPFLTMSILKEEMKELPFEQRLHFMTTTGRPFFNVEIKVIKDNGMDVVPDGNDVGEIIAKGETITPGYWSLPEENAKRIVDSWLYTRDLAVVDPEGYITIVDRKDDMIISGGENVYSIEVENALYEHPSVLEAAVIGLPDPVWGEKIAAVIVRKKECHLSEKDVIEFCEERLASFKVPKTVLFTEHLPKTGSSKIYKFKLRQIFSDI